MPRTPTLECLCEGPGAACQHAYRQTGDHRRSGTPAVARSGDLAKVRSRARRRMSAGAHAQHWPPDQTVTARLSTSLSHALETLVSSQLFSLQFHYSAYSANTQLTVVAVGR